MTQFGEPHEFWMNVGRTLDVWQRVEQLLCEIFVTITQPTVGDVVRAAFYEITSVQTKRAMITSALAVRLAGDEFNSRWKALSKKIEKAARKRNDLAHGTRWDNAGTSVLGPHMNDVRLREKHMASRDEDYLDAAGILALQKTFWQLQIELSQFDRDLGLATMSFGKPINLPG